MAYSCTAAHGRITARHHIATYSHISVYFFSRYTAHYCKNDLLSSVIADAFSASPYVCKVSAAAIYTTAL